MQWRLDPLTIETPVDLMARIAGLELVERWGGWQREPFTASSVRHVSVYRRRPLEG